MKKESVCYASCFTTVDAYRKLSDIFIAIQRGEQIVYREATCFIGILKCSSGHLQNTNLSEQAKYPKILNQFLPIADPVCI